jgi:hypothetical protein
MGNRPVARPVAAQDTTTQHMAGCLIPLINPQLLVGRQPNGNCNLLTATELAKEILRTSQNPKAHCRIRSHLPLLGNVNPAPNLRLNLLRFVLIVSSHLL